MRLVPMKLSEQLPMLFTQPRLGGDAVAYIKFFTPDANWAWYVTEFDGEDTFFGYVDGEYKELGFFHLSDLEKVRGPLGLPVKRDTHWKPKKLRMIHPSFRVP